jgi:hypothetical protein
MTYVMPNIGAPFRTPTGEITTRFGFRSRNREIDGRGAVPSTSPSGSIRRTVLFLKRASTSRSSGEWNDDDFDVLADRAVVGRILKVHVAPVGTPWMWTLAFGHHEDRTPTHGYAATREAAMAAFAKRWRRE